jgi:aminomethyltransferase
MVDFHGWLLPVQYQGVLTEHRHCRRAAVVFDTSHMGQFLFASEVAGRALGRVCTQNAERLAVGACRYGFLLNEQAGIIDDTILMRLGEREYLLVVNAGTAGGDWAWMKAHLPAALEMTDLCARGWGKIDLQGPESFAVLAGRVDFELSRLRYYTARRGACIGRSCVVSRTGYTGELGYEIMAEGGDLQAIFDDLLSDGRVKPAGLGARDSLRLEMGYPLYGQEISIEHNPVEAGLTSFARCDHDFIGAERLGGMMGVRPGRVLAAFKVLSRRRASTSDRIFRDGEAVGVVTSGAFAPSLDVAIGMGYVRSDLAEPGTELVVDTGRVELAATICRKPPYDGGTARIDVENMEKNA